MYETGLGVMVETAKRLQDVLDHHTQRHADALAAKSRAQSAFDAAKRRYDELEKELKLDLAMSDLLGEDEQKPKKKMLADDLKLQKEVAVIKARRDGLLASAWRALSDAQDTLEDANLSYAQTNEKLNSTRIAACLQSDMLASAAVDDRTRGLVK